MTNPETRKRTRFSPWIFGLLVSVELLLERIPLFGEPWARTLPLMSPITLSKNQPLQSRDEGEDFYKERYPQPMTDAQKKPSVGADPEKQVDEFRNYEADARPTVREFYRLNHANQTYEFGLAKRKEHLGRNRLKMGIWEAAENLNQLVDDPDPDPDLSQLEHLLQMAEHLRADGQPRWMILTGFVHDLGKILCLWGEPQWAVVGDTFPNGWADSPKIVFPKFFEANPDFRNPRFQTKKGVYEEGCGFNAVNLSGPRRIYLQCLQGLPAEGSPLQAARPQLLPVASRGRIRPFPERPGPQASAGRAGL